MARSHLGDTDVYGRIYEERTSGSGTWGMDWIELA